MRKKAPTHRNYQMKHGHHIGDRRVHIPRGRRVPR